MKTSTLIIAAVLSLQVSTLFAGSDCPITRSNNDPATYCISLEPSTPAEATFGDEYNLSDSRWLAPSTPAEATFEDEVETTGSGLLHSLAPVTPAEADFSDNL